MNIKFRSNLEDVLNYDMKKNKENKLENFFRNFLIYSLALSIIFCIVGVSMYSNMETAIVFIILGALFLILYFKFFPKFLMWSVKNGARVKVKLKPEIINENVLEIQYDSISITNEKNESHILQKKDIKDIIEFNNNICIDTLKLVNFLPYFIIPLNTFKDKEEKEEFLRLLNTFM